MIKDRLKGSKVLIVDDTPRNIQILGSVLKEAGFSINIATNGREAIETAKKVIPDIILLDVMMPELDGFEACKILKSDEITQKIPIIFLTAKTEAKDILHGFDLGAADYVTKPFNSAELLARVKMHLEIQKSRVYIEKQNQDRQTLIKVLGHDLTNSLSGLRGIVEVYETVNAIEEVKELLPFFRTGVENSLQIVQMVRTMQQLDNETHEWILAHLRIKNAIDDTINILSKKYHEKNISVIADMNENDCVIAEKNSLTELVLLNVIDNCYKFSPIGGSFSIVGRSLEEDYYEISFKDHGIGIPPKILDHIFEYGLNKIRAGAQGEHGIGFGLILVKRFMSEIYGGRVEVQSKVADAESLTEVKLIFQKGSAKELQDI